MTLEGPLNKWTNHFHGWQYRYFVLDMHKGLLSYYLFKEHIAKGEMRGCIRLNEAFVGYDKDDDILFTITVGDETFHLQASNLAEKEKWVSCIEKAIILSHSKAVNSIDNIETNRISQEEILASADKFDSTVTELDAYLQLLIAQHHDLEVKWIEMTSTAATNSSENNSNLETNQDNKKELDLMSEDPQKNSEINNTGDELVENSDPETMKEKTNIQLMLASTKTLIETIKHSIVCLQIAKVNCDPRNGLHTNNDLQQVISFFNKNTTRDSLSNIKADSSTNLSSSSNSERFNSNNFNSSNQNDNSNRLKIPIATFTNSDDDEAKSEQGASKRNIGNNNNEYEDLSYNNFHTDDDNDSFYDAVSSGGEAEENDNNASDIIVSEAHNTNKNNENSNEVLVAEKLVKIVDQSTEIVKPSDDEDDEFDEEDLDINSQSSVITHLLTQVRIGMDLTKITLPTFILETRSLLEMYADFFAATELFLQIPDIKCPHERMIQVVRWYMSTFRAGRKSPVAKKPYNPILGEIFQCWYNLPNSSKEENKKVIRDGPVPWATNDQLSFIAEQVSHHPPISAFYAEHYDKRVQLEGYTWTKSSFLGLSIAVHMVGKATLTLLELGEDYVMTFPSAYGRSILGVPWFEMGGQVQIDCLKTGYQSTIQFLTKPFYGGKKHQISGTISGPDKKVLNTIEGDWNGTMFLKSGKKIEILINTQAMSMIRKQTRKLKEQCEYESRKIWKDVTYNLRSKQLDLATLGKQRIEQRQRDGVKRRKEQNIKYETRYFQSKGEQWTYSNPLKNRLYLESASLPS